MTSRRLSRGCAIIQEVPGNDDEAEREQLRAQREKRRLSHTPLARRRLSGGIPQAEPDRNVLEIYDRCIKLSAENKINRQNTWDLSLIDHIDDVIGHTGANTNFQRASCTLDASVKIYSYRVDSVHHDMFKVLGGLNRSDDNEKEDGEPTQDDHNCEDEVVNESSAPTNRSRQRNRQQQLNSHLELKPLALCVSLSELLFEVDPMFQRTASSFDEGGAKGLLMNQLNVGQRCHIVFDFYADLGQDADVDAETCNFIIPSSFLSLCSNFRDLDLEISPFTSKLRSALRDDESNFNPEEILAENEPVSLLEKIPLEDSDGYNIPHDNADYDDDDDDVGDPFIVDNLENDDGFSFPDDNEHHSEHLQPGSQEAGNSIEPQTIAQHHLDQRNFADMCSANAEISSPTYSRRSTALFSEANGLNLPSLQMNKNWAGPGVCMSHWRFKGESQQNIANQDPELELVNTKLKKTRITCDIDFRAPSIPDSDLADPVRASNVLSKASYAKSASVNHLLPTDLHINQAVLFRLFHRPHFFLRPGRNASASRNIHNGLSAGGFSNDPSHFGEYLNDDDDDECAPICDDAEPDPRLASEFHFVEQPATAEKIELDFAKSVKKVDIKAVKQCLWSTLSEKTSSAPPLLIEDVQEPTTPEEWPSFRDTIQAVPVPETSREAMSVQLYFICLLHLANENDLVLKPLDTSLGDFSIGRRAIPSGSRRDQ